MGFGEKAPVTRRSRSTTKRRSLALPTVVVAQRLVSKILLLVQASGARGQLDVDQILLAFTQNSH